MAQQSARQGWENQGFPQCFKHALGDLDLARELPYRPAADYRASQAGQMAASDYWRPGRVAELVEIGVAASPAR